MVDMGALVARIRSHGANVFLDAGKVEVVNAKKLPAGAMDFISRNEKELATFLEKEGDLAERSAIIEHDGGLPRSEADDLARLLFENRPSDVDAADWTWFVSKAAEVLDRRRA